MRRISQKDTLHGTLAGQIPNDQELAEQYGLSERQSQCAVLLKLGVKPTELPKQLGISPSTVEKHLAFLRVKMGAPTTAALQAFLKEQPQQDVTPFHSWPPLPHPIGRPDMANSHLISRLRGATRLEKCLEVLRDELAEFSVRHVYYAFIPLSVPGLLRNDVFDFFLAPKNISEAFTASGGLLAQPMTQQLFESPAAVLFFDAEGEKGDALAPSVHAFYEECRKTGCRFAVGFGFPAGGSYVGMSMTLAEGDPDTMEHLVHTKGEHIRSAAMVMHSMAFANGALAAHFGLTLRERDAISAIARGLKASEAAAEMKISNRAFDKLTAAARDKFRAGTLPEAIYKAAAANALVFFGE